MAGMSKKFKWIYYPILAIVSLVLLILGMVDGLSGCASKVQDNDFYTAVRANISAISGSSHSAMSENDLATVRSRIINTLTTAGFTLQAEVKENEDSDDEPTVTVTDWAKGDSNRPIYTVTEQTAFLTDELLSGIEGKDDGHIAAATTVTNVIAAIPGTDTKAGNEGAGAIIITARFDTRDDTDGATSNSAFVATLAQTLAEFADADAEFKNDIIVVFTEAQGYHYGDYAFMRAFEGFSGAVGRAKLGLNVEAYGTGGTLAITDSTNDALVTAVSKTTGGAMNSSITNAALSSIINESALGAFDVPAVQVSILGDLGAYVSQDDTAERVTDNVLYQQAQFIQSFIETFGQTSATYGGNGEGVFFSYLDIGTVNYSKVAAYVFGSIILALMAATFIVNALRKTKSINAEGQTVEKRAFNAFNILKAIGCQLLIMVSALAVLYGAYFLIALMLVGFGVLPIYSITSLVAYNTGVFVAALLLAVAVSFAFTALYKKLFKVKATDLVRATAVIVALIGAILSFAAVPASYLFAWVGLLSMIVFLLTTIFKGAFGSRFGFDIERLFLYCVPVALCLPFIMPALIVLSKSLNMLLLPIIVTVFALFAQFATAYLDYANATFDKIAKRLPPRVMRVQHTVVERIEDRAKKGKFTEQTVTKVENVRVKWNYKNYFGVSLVCALATVLILSFGGAGTATFSRSITGFYDYDDAIYNDAIVYSWDNTTGTATKRVEIRDLSVYKYARYAIDDLLWDSEKGVYYKTDNSDIVVPGNAQPSITKSGSLYTVTCFDKNRSYVSLSFADASAITSITITAADNDEETYTYEFLRQETIELVMPYGFGDFTMTVEGASNSRITYTEKRPGTDSPIINTDEWNDMIAYYANSNIASNLRAGIVLTNYYTL